jgi:uncharacterized membrane protein SirB2
MTNTPTKFPTFKLLLCLVTYAGLLLVTVSVAIGKWSELAVLAYAYLLFIAPVVMGVIVYDTRRERHSSAVHRFTFYAGVFYFYSSIALLASYTFFNFLVS